MRKKKTKTHNIVQPKVEIQLDQITFDTTYYTNLYSFAPDARFALTKTKKGVYLVMNFDAYLESIGNPLFIRFADDHVLSMMPVKAIRPIHSAFG
ncbi:hypothetical protein OCK74_15085 [Chitinophagaceae bacterium LB-8]|uniref:Uncharacterized protein n=1 Tax=Paraflavisolibacter caeni TaxID=2982496 RepID=A0A9X2XW23_9BACT|nr:hypothetical protein [Paraflavisolibacter caeni]MCU7550444.1 hypothetical protein [Paraflavisolibacter caeni]